MRRRIAPILLAVLLLAAGGALLWFRSRSKLPAPATTEASGRSAPGGQAVRDPATLPAMLRDSSWQTRLAAVHALRTMTTLDVPRRATLLAEGLDREAAAPASGPPFTGSYLPLGSVIQLQYLAVLSSLGPAAADAVKAATPPATSAGREWRTLALAATKDKSSAPSLRGLLGSSDPAVRMTAARYLGLLGDRDAVPALQRALSDPFTTTMVSDTPREPSAKRRGFHPVREQAARALRVLGVKVERRGDSYVVN